MTTFLLIVSIPFMALSVGYFYGGHLEHRPEYNNV